MKTIQTLLLLTGLSVVGPILAADSETNAPTPDTSAAVVSNTVSGAVAESSPLPATPATNAVEVDVDRAGAANASSAAAPTVEASPAKAGLSSTVMLPNGEIGLRLNFRGAPLEMVLNYLSEAAGFIIVLDTQVKGKVDVWSNTPLSKDEAIDLLNSVLNKNGYAAIRNGRTLTIVNKDEAKARDIPVHSGSDPDGIPRNDQIVTQIIPIRFVEAAQLIKDLQPLVSSQTTMTANEAGNSIVITDTQANIRRVAEVIKAIDTGAEDVTEVRVFHLRYADPTEMAQLLGNVFPDDSRSGASQSPVQFGTGPFGGGGGFRGFFGGGGGGNNNRGATSSNGTQNQRIKKRARVIAVADPRTSSVIVSATKDLIDQIAGMVEQLDANPARKQNVYVYSLDNADATEVQSVLEDMFERNTSSTSRNSRNGANQNNALQNRANQNQNPSTTGQGTTGFGNRGVGSGGGGGGGF